MAQRPYLFAALLLALGVAAGAALHWGVSKYTGADTSRIVLQSASVTSDSEFLTLRYAIGIDAPEGRDPFVMVRASVHDDKNVTARDMGHSGSVLGDGEKSGQIQQRLHILDRLAEPYVLVVVTLTAADGSVIERRPFVVPIHDAEQGARSAGVGLGSG